MARLLVVLRGLRRATAAARSRDDRAPARRTPTARASCSSSGAALVRGARHPARSACATSMPPERPADGAHGEDWRTRRTSCRWPSRPRSAAAGPLRIFGHRLPDARRHGHPRLRPCRRPRRRPPPGASRHLADGGRRHDAQPWDRARARRSARSSTAVRATAAGRSSVDRGAPPGRRPGRRLGRCRPGGGSPGLAGAARSGRRSSRPPGAGTRRIPTATAGGSGRSAASDVSAIALEQRRRTRGPPATRRRPAPAPPGRLHHVAVPEADRDVHPRRARRGRAAGLPDPSCSRCSASASRPMHPEAAPWVAPGALPAVPVARRSWPANVRFLRRAPAALPRDARRRCSAGPGGSPNFLLGGIGIFPKVVHAAA